jgi:glycosyltransferase involved in cell wall biosynthesis
MSGPKKKFIINLLKSADGFVAISDLCKRMVEKYVTSPVVVAYPFPHRNFSKVKSNIKSKNALFVGRNDKTKGFTNLVEAIKILRENDKEWNLYLIGECSKSVKEEEGIHTKGFVSDMVPYFEKCAYFVHPADFDPCPATVFEAMNAGMITVISNNIGQTDIFRSNKLNNLILESNSPEAISNKLLQLSQKNNSLLSKKLKTMSKDFDESKRLKIFKKQFERLIGEIQ